MAPPRHPHGSCWHCSAVQRLPADAERAVDCRGQAPHPWRTVPATHGASSSARRTGTPRWLCAAVMKTGILALAVMAQCPEVHRPPAYYERASGAACDSVARLRRKPERLAPPRPPAAW